MDAAVFIKQNLCDTDARYSFPNLNATPSAQEATLSIKTTEQKFTD